MAAWRLQLDTTHYRMSIYNTALSTIAFINGNFDAVNDHVMLIEQLKN